MIRLGKQEEVQEYFDTNRVSQSYLKALIKGVDHIWKDEKKMYYEEKGNLIVGSAVDDLISMGKIAFDKAYHVSEVDKPSDTIKSIINQVFDEVTEAVEDVTSVELRDSIGHVLNACNDHKYYKNWKDETRVNKIIEGGEAYFNDLKSAYGKQVLSLTEATVVENIKMSWTSHKFTSKYFEHGPGVEIYYQVPIYFEYMGVECKALIDMLIINHNNRTIQPIDFKTMAGATTSFGYSFKSFRYDFQGAFYFLALSEFFHFRGGSTPISELNESLSIMEASEEEYGFYNINSFKFMVETTSHSTNDLNGTIYNQGSPLMYEMSTESHVLGLDGRPEVVYSTHSRITKVEIENKDPRQIIPIKSREILGINQAMVLYLWHSENGFELDRYVVESNGLIEI